MPCRRLSAAAKQNVKRAYCGTAENSEISMETRRRKRRLCLPDAWMLLVVVGASTCTSDAAQRPLCPRGSYSLLEHSSGLNELKAIVLLPTRDYTVSLVPELASPSTVVFTCTPPKSTSRPLSVQYARSLQLRLSRVVVRDAEGVTTLALTLTAARTAKSGAEKTCLSGAECAKDQFCDTTPACPGAGVKGACTPRPKLCPTTFRPVQTCAGLSYTNRCEAASEGQPIREPVLGESAERRAE